MWQRKGTLVSMFLFSCLVNVLMLTGPMFMLQVYDRVLSSGSVPTLLALCAIVLVLFIYYGFLEALRSRVMMRLGRSFEERIRLRVYDVVAMLALKKAPSTGGQPLSDMATIRQYISGQGLLAFFDMPWVPVYFGVCYLLHPWLGYAGIAACIVIFVLALLTEASTRKPLADATAAMSKANAQTEEARRNAEALFALGMKGALQRRWAKLQQEALDAFTRAGDASGTLGAMSRVTRLMVQSGMLALGAYLAIYQEISPGAIIASSIIMSRGLAPIEQAVGNWQQFLGFRKAIERLNMAMEKIPAEDTRMQLPPPRGLLEVDGLIVMVPGTEKPVLQGLTFKVEPGRGLGVIGPTGAGKSTLSRAIVGVIEPTRGTVRLDGATHDQRGVDEMGSYIGYLPQDVQIFDGTVAQNISRFDESPKSEDIVAAAKLANIHDLIMRLPQGYDTNMGDNGQRLSMGQRQRLALARALYGDPALIVMDEPNSNLDAEGEIALDGAVRACLARGAAVVIVAHRPSALQAVHDILVLTEGKQAAYGTRDEIFKQVSRPRVVAPGEQGVPPSPVTSDTRN
jgi:PrtD family type I secretion system ABC transporter